MIFVAGGVVTLLRDDRTDIAFPNLWDLPGGGCDPGEGAWSCFARETREEVGLGVPRAALVWARTFRRRGGIRAFFVLRMPWVRARDLRLGSEGQAVAVMPVARFIRHPRAIPEFRARVAAAEAVLAARGVRV